MIAAIVLTSNLSKKLEIPPPIEPPNPAQQVDRLVIFTALLSAGTPFGIYSYIVEELTEAVIDALKKNREDMMG